VFTYLYELIKRSFMS